MESIQLDLDSKGHGRFYIRENNEQIGEMVIEISEGIIKVYHTEVLPKDRNKGIAKELINVMVKYARENNLKVIAFCPYVFAHFKRSPDEYKDVWRR